jgi:hypothetical protein
VDAGLSLSTSKAQLEGLRKVFSEEKFGVKTREQGLRPKNSWCEDPVGAATDRYL